jgi:hypothetical protein
MIHVPPALFVALAELVPALHAHCAGPWCVIGSAAVRLLGAEVGVADVDVLVSRADADTLAALWADRCDAAQVPADGDRFRSRFARYRFPGLPVELMGGLEVFGADGWQPLHIRETVCVGLAGLRVPVPSIAEQLRVLACFARPKDHQRAAVLRALPVGTASAAMLPH